MTRPVASAASRRTAPAEHRPALIVMVGAPGSGKSYLGRQIAEGLGADLIQTDNVRKEMYPEPLYTPTEAASVYRACHERIRLALAQGRRVVFDGTNLRERRRATLYRLADEAAAQLMIVLAYAPKAVIRERLAQRGAARDPLDASDADWPIHLRLRRDAEPVSRPHLVANTVAAPGSILRVLCRRLGD